MTQKLLKQVYVIPRLKVIATKIIKVSYKSKALFTLHQHLVSLPIFDGVRIADLFSFRCCVVFFVCLCHVRPMLLVSPDCPFWNGPPVFSDVYYEYYLFII